MQKICGTGKMFFFFKAGFSSGIRIRFKNSDLQDPDENGPDPQPCKQMIPVGMGRKSRQYTIFQ